MADDDLVMKLPTGKICQFKNGKATLHGSCRVPKADALVRRSNRLVKGHPTCAQLLEASKLLQRASDLYDEDQSNHDISGEVRNIGRAVSWSEDRAKAGKCRGGKHGELDGVKAAQRAPVLNHDLRVHPGAGNTEVR